MAKRYLILLLFLVSEQIFSQSNLIYKNIEIPDISSNEIQSLFIDINGFNWISTNEGLNRAFIRFSPD